MSDQTNSCHVIARRHELARGRSVIIAALIESEESHAECRSLLLGEHPLALYTHALAEVFNILTGSRLGFRIPAPQAAKMLREKILSRVEIISLSAEEMLTAMEEAEPRGVRGGAVFDWMHLVAAKKAKAEKLCTLDVEDFQHMHRTGDPEIVHSRSCVPPAA